MSRSPRSPTAKAHSASMRRACSLSACALLLAGCAGARSETHAANATRARAIGRGVTLRGPRSGERVRVTLTAFTPKLPGSVNDHPEFDYQFAAAHMRVQNLGSLPYSGAPAKQLSVISTESQVSRSAQLSEGSCSGGFARALRLAPGASAEGCVPTQVLVVSTPATLSFAPFGGGSEAARWSLRHPRRTR